MEEVKDLSNSSSNVYWVWRKYAWDISTINND